jgi:hypothetical protein
MSEPIFPSAEQPDDAPGALPRRFLSSPRICKRYDICAMTLRRWRRDPRVEFPKPDLTVRDRDSWLEETLVRWERRCAARRTELQPEQVAP